MSKASHQKGKNVEGIIEQGKHEDVSQEQINMNQTTNTLNIQCSVASLNPLSKGAKKPVPDLSKTQFYSLSKCSSMQDQNFANSNKRKANASIDEKAASA